MSSNGSSVITWIDSRYGDDAIFFQRYNSMDIAQGNNEIANDDVGRSADQFRPSIAMDGNGNFVIVWEDYRYGVDNPDIIGQRYYPNGTKRGSNYRIVADGPFKLETYPVVTGNSQQLVFSWVDNRRSKGWDIFAKLTTWDWEGVTSVSEQRQLPDAFCLFQNYPNPFSPPGRGNFDNPSTTIEFTLPQSSIVKLKIYNILGKEVASLVSERLAAGNYQYHWTATGMPAGVYFYQLRADKFSQTRKMILIS